MHALSATTPADDVAEILLTAEEIAAKVKELGTEIARDYQGKDVVFVSILKGALPFLADLMRATPIPLALDFLEVSSYGSSTETSGAVRILKDLANPIEGRDVLVVEDILDTGHTLAYVIEHLHAQRPASVRRSPWARVSPVVRCAARASGARSWAAAEGELAEAAAAGSARVSRVRRPSRCRASRGVPRSGTRTSPRR